MILCMLAITPTAKADCSHALNACNLYVKALEEDGQLLHKKIDLQAGTISKLTTELKKAAQPDLLPTWVWFVGGVVVGSAVVWGVSKH